MLLQRSVLWAVVCAALCGCGDNPSGSNAGGSGGTGGEAGAAGAVGGGGAAQGGGGAAQGGGGAGGSEAQCPPIDLSGPSQAVDMPAGCTGTTCTSVGFTPLNDLAGSAYLGVPGGLYCDSNERPASYEAEGVAAASAVEPLDAAGNPDPNGKYALVAIGMSHTTFEFQAFLSKYEGDPSLDPHLALVDGALSGHATPQWLDPQNEVWTNLDMRLANKNVTNEQVVALWVKLAQQEPQTECDQAGFQGTPCFPAHAEKLAVDIRTILGMLAARFVNAKLVYLSSRSYGGYATSTLNPDPYAYQSGFSVKKLIVEKINGAPEAAGLPFLAWGPYLWADGTTPRSDGLTWVLSEFVADGTHPSADGRKKVADMLFDFFSSDTTTASWFKK